MEKSALLKKLEKQDLIIYSVGKYLNVIHEKSQKVMRILVLCFCFVTALFLFISGYYKESIEDPDFLFATYSYSSLFIFFFFVFLSSSYFNKRKKTQFDKYMKIKKEYILDNSNNLDVLFEEISINGISNVSSRTSKNIIEKKREQLLDGKDIDSEDLLKETINLNKKEKEKEEIDLINY